MGEDSSFLPLPSTILSFLTRDRKRGGKVPSHSGGNKSERMSDVRNRHVDQYRKLALKKEEEEEMDTKEVISNWQSDGDVTAS